MKKYISSGRGYTDQDADNIGRFIDEKFNGNVTPEELLSAASHPSSPIHKYFEWDDTKAANGYRLWQARKLISCVCVVEGGQVTRAFHSCVVESNGHSERSYFSNELVQDSDDLKTQVILYAHKQLNIWKARYRHYEVFFPVVEQIDRLEKEIGNGKEEG